METRGSRILRQLKDKERIQHMSVASYESTKGTTKKERLIALSFQDWKISENSTAQECQSFDGADSSNQPLQSTNQEPITRSDTSSYTEHVLSSTITNQPLQSTNQEPITRSDTSSYTEHGFSSTITSQPLQSTNQEPITRSDTSSYTEHGLSSTITNQPLQSTNQEPITRSDTSSYTEHGLSSTITNQPLQSTNQELITRSDISSYADHGFSSTITSQPLQSTNQEPITLINPFTFDIDHQPLDNSLTVDQSYTTDGFQYLVENIPTLSVDETDYITTKDDSCNKTYVELRTPEPSISKRKSKSDIFHPRPKKSKIVKYNLSSEDSLSDSDDDSSSSEESYSLSTDNDKPKSSKSVKKNNVNKVQKYTESDPKNERENSTNQTTNENYVHTIEDRNWDNNQIMAQNETVCTNSTFGNQSSYFESRKKIVLQQISNTNEKRVYDKKQACIFCCKIVVKLPQHFESVHKDKKQVQDYLNLPKNSHERANAIRSLRNRGNFRHNASVLKNKTGSLLVCRRSSGNFDYRDYLPCEYCLGYYFKKKLYRHIRTCPDRPNKPLKPKSKVQRNAALLLPPDPHATDIFKEILANMRNDKKTAVVKEDALLCLFGSKEATKHKDLPHTRNHTSYKVRLFAELIIYLNETNTGITSALQCVMPENFALVATAVINISSGLDKPSNGLKLGHYLKKCSKIVRSQSIIDGNDVLRKKAEDFLTLYEDEWEDRVSQGLHAVLYKRKFNKEVKLPSTDDIMKLHKFIAQKEEEFIGKNFEGVKYVEVAYVTLCHIIVFNRRRVGEVSLMEKDCYIQRQRANKPHGEVAEMLSAAEQNLYSDFEIVHIRGKKGSKVDCLLTPQMIKCIDYLVSTREENGVLPSNKYVFCLPNSEFCMRGCDAIKYVARNSEADFPTDLKSTKLRKHISTVSQLLNLKENEINSLCKHMGHNPRVHMEYYQMPEETIQKTKIGKILLALEQGTLRQHKGKSLAEIDIGMNINNAVDPHETNIINKPTVENADFRIPSISDSSDDELNHIKQPQTSTGPQKKIPIKQKKPTKRVTWSREEMQKLKDFFQEEILLAEGPPTKKRCEAFLIKYPEFKSRGNYLPIKWRVNAIIQQERKQKKFA